jgi:hypothetical protein
MTQYYSHDSNSTNTPCAQTPVDIRLSGFGGRVGTSAFTKDVDKFLHDIVTNSSVGLSVAEAVDGLFDFVGFGVVGGDACGGEAIV